MKDIIISVFFIFFIFFIILYVAASIQALIMEHRGRQYCRTCKHYKNGCFGREYKNIMCFQCIREIEDHREELQAIIDSLPDDF